MSLPLEQQKYQWVLAKDDYIVDKVQSITRNLNRVASLSNFSQTSSSLDEAM